MQEIRILLPVAFSLLILAGNREVPAADFLRGDANGDGQVSAADEVAIFDYIFVNSQDSRILACPDAADVNDDEDIDIIDGGSVRMFLLQLRPFSISSPYPEAGPDPTSDEPVQLGCSVYGGGSVIEDTRARLELADIHVNGGGKGRGFIVLALTNVGAAAAVAGVIAFEPGLVASVGEATTFHENYTTVFKLAGDRLSFYTARRHPANGAVLPAGLAAPILEIPVCLAAGTPAGSYPVRIESAELVDADTRASIRPQRVNGVLTVSAAVTATEDCSQEPPPPPPPVNARFELEGGTAPPGGEAEVTFIIRADAEVQAYAFSVDFEEEVLVCSRVEELWKRPDGQDFSFKVYEFNNQSDAPGNGGVDEGFVVGAAIFDFHRPVVLPADTDNRVLRFHFQVNPETTARSTTLRFLDGGKGTGEPVPNMVTAHSRRQYTQTDAESFVFISGEVGVLPDVVTFIRADSNGDGGVNLTDAMATLGFLFLGEDAVRCFDAADANDDGQINIADPLTALTFLFLDNSSPLPPPFPGLGEDPSPDRMGCLYRRS